MANQHKVKSFKAMREGIPNLGLWAGDFSAKSQHIYPTDLDGLVEVNGEFLVHEYKKDGTPITEGQRIMMDRMLAKGMTVVTLWHQGPCFDMNIVRFQVALPDYLAQSGRRYFLVDDGDIIKRARDFHAWWTLQVLNLKPQPAF